MTICRVCKGIALSGLICDSCFAEREADRDRVMRLPEMEWASVTSVITQILASAARAGFPVNETAAMSALDAGKVYVSRLRARADKAEKIGFSLGESIAIAKEFDRRNEGNKAALAEKSIQVDEAQEEIKRLRGWQEQALAQEVELQVLKDNLALQTSRNSQAEVALMSLKEDWKCGLKIANDLTLETQTFEEACTDLVRQVRESRDKVAWLHGRLRQTAQALIAEVGADGPMSAEDAALKAVDHIIKQRALLLEVVESLEDALPYKGGYLAWKHGDYEEAAEYRRRGGLPPGSGPPPEVVEFQRWHGRATDRADSAPCLDCSGPREIKTECQGCTYHEEDGDA